LALLQKDIVGLAQSIYLLKMPVYLFEVLYLLKKLYCQSLSWVSIVIVELLSLSKGKMSRSVGPLETEGVSRCKLGMMFSYLMIGRHETCSVDIMRVIKIFPEQKQAVLNSSK